jgi:hypothetical protein
LKANTDIIALKHCVYDNDIVYTLYEYVYDKILTAREDKHLSQNTASMKLILYQIVNPFNERKNILLLHPLHSKQIFSIEKHEWRSHNFSDHFSRKFFPIGSPLGHNGSNDTVLIFRYRVYSWSEGQTE